MSRKFFEHVVKTGESAKGYLNKLGKYLMTEWEKLPDWLPLPPSGLIHGIIQDADSGAVLMLVDLNQEALERIAATGRIHYYHPGKRKVLAKGEDSGHFQEVREIRLNCQGNQVVLRVRPHGGACESGYHSCFFRRFTPEGWETADPRAFDPAEVYPEIAFSH